MIVCERIFDLHDATVEFGHQREGGGEELEIELKWKRR